MKRKWYKYTEKHLNHIPYDYTVEVTNRFKGLDLVDRVPEESQGREAWWASVYGVAQSRTRLK